MPRTPRPCRFAPGQPNHVVIRANNRRRLFSYPHERLTYLRLLSRAMTATACALHAICLVDNHGHLLLTPPSVEAGSRCIKLVNQRYAQTRNQRRGGSGKLFEERFFSRAIENDAQYALTMMYIEANPHRAGLPDPDYHPWSSLAIHSGTPAAARIPPDLIQLDGWYLALGPTRAARAATYQRLFREYLGLGCEPAHVADVEPLEGRDPDGDRRRLLRPDGTSAAEPSRFYVLLQKHKNSGGLEG